MPGFSKLTRGLAVFAAVVVVSRICFVVGDIVAAWPAAMTVLDWLAEYFPLLLCAGAILTVLFLFKSGYCSANDPDQPPGSPQF